MGDADKVAILALVPQRMKVHMQALETVATGFLKQVPSLELFDRASSESAWQVVLIPARGFTSEQWWSLWGSVNSMEPRPCILVYALRSDFEMWSSVLEAGGYDVIVAPFTAAKLQQAFHSAIEEFTRRQEH